MLEISHFQVLENTSVEQIDKQIDFISQVLFKGIKSDLNLEPFNTNIKFIIIKESSPEETVSKDVFRIGVNRFIQNNIVIVEIYEEYRRFLSFIILREVYNCFIPDKLKNFHIIQLVINQLLLNDLFKSPHLNEWRSLIRRYLENTVLLSKGYSQLWVFDRLEQYFKMQGTKALQFFFRYIRRNISLLNNKTGDIHEIFFREFTDYFSKSMQNNEIVETLRCIIQIFHKVKNFRDLLSYKNYFKQFKEIGELDTPLSLYKFNNNMNWISSYSYIAPSYQLNWNVINVCLISVFLRFNPILDKGKVLKVIKLFPFFASLKILNKCFAIDLSGYIVIPKIYLNDFLRFIKKLKDYGYVLTHRCLLLNKSENFLNLNYFREYSKNHRVIDPNHRHYREKYEIDFKINYGLEYYKTELSLLDFLIIDRIRFFSVSGLGFERRNDTLNIIKSDLLNIIINERTKVKDLRVILEEFHNFEDLKKKFLYFLERNKKFGFFFIHSLLKECLVILSAVKELLESNPDIRNIIQFRELIEVQIFSQSIEDNLIFKNHYIKKIIYKEIIPAYFESRKLYQRKLEEYRSFYKLFESCFSLKLFDLDGVKKLVSNRDLVGILYKTKRAKLKEIYEKFKLYKITNNEIEGILTKFLNNNPPLIQPNLMNTVVTKMFVNDFLQLLIKDSQENRIKIDDLKKYFPRTIINISKDLVSSESLLHIEFSCPYLTKKEKDQLFSILINNFKDDLIYGESYLWNGFSPVLSRKHFYDFQKKQFFYTKALYGQLFLSIQKIFDKPFRTQLEKRSHTPKKMWSTRQKTLTNLISAVKMHDSLENTDISLENLNKLVKLNKTLKNNLLNEEKLKKLKAEYFFKNFIKSIRITPAFQNFGLEQFYLYFFPTDIDEIDFRLLFLNTFQKIKYPTCIDNSNSLLIKFLMPHRNPNMKYFNWLVRTKKIIREYMAFSVKKIHQIFHINYNLSFDGWNYDADKFKIYMQNILLNPDYDVPIQGIKTFNSSDILDSNRFEPSSAEFNDLVHIYNWRSVDLKSFIGSNKHSMKTRILNLLKKNLIFPYIRFKNLGFQKKVYIFLPNIKAGKKSILFKIFSFFNAGFIHEIKGEFYIYGFPQEIKFEEGLMIKLYFPKCEISEFISVFNLLFQYLEIKHYLILNDLNDGKNLIKSVFGNLDFMKRYNPLKNLQWNGKDKIWMNHKSFTEKFEKIYPDLMFKDRSQEKSFNN